MTRAHFTPRAYHGMAIAHLHANPRAALWASMGSGKGAMVLDALAGLELTEDIYPALAIGPLRVARDVWPKETAKWEHLKHLNCVPIIGTPEARRRALKYESPIYSINYENLGWLLEHVTPERWPFQTVIADESTKLKSYRGSYRTHHASGKVYLQQGGGTRARALGTVAHERVSRFIELSGTPAPNGLQDLWGQVWFLDRGERLGRTFEAFSQRWFRPKYDGYGIEPLPGAEEEIHARLKDICLTIDVADYYDIDEPIVNDIEVHLPPDAMRLYREMEKSMFIQLQDATVEAFGAAARTQKCLQLANGAVYIDPLAQDDRDVRSKEWKAIHNAKMEALDSIVGEANGAPMMVVYTFRSDLARILKAYPKQAVDLSTTAGEKAFRAGEAQLGVCHPDSLGHGVDGLQDVCNAIVHFGHGWSLDTYDQINARIGPVRQMQAGHKRPVYVHHIVAAGTLDEDVMERRRTKRDVQDILLDAMKRRFS